MNESSYFNAAIPEPVTLLGLRLRPFSLGHVVLLHRVESAFMTGAVPDFSDLALSVFICSQTYAEALEALDNIKLPRLFLEWHNRLTGNGILSRLGLRKVNPIDLVRKCIEFKEYMDAGSLHPDFSYDESKVGKSLKLPLVQVVKVRLMQELGLDDEKIMDRPWGLCLWDYLTLRAMDGTLDIVDDSEMQEAQRLANAIAEKMRAN